MKNKTNERIRQYLLIFLFLFVLFLPIADNLIRIFPDTYLLENRQLAAFPVMTQGNIAKFQKDFESFYNDNFGLRKYLIKANNMLIVRLFSVSPNTKVVLGKEKWLYFAGEDEAIYNYKKKLKEKELRLYFDILKNRKEFFAKQSIQYFMVIVPDKQSLYQEYLPEHIRRLNENSKYDQITDYLSNNSLDINIDVKKTLLKEKQTGHIIYYKTDSHWNDYGSFLAYKEIMKRLEEYYPELKPMPLADFDFSEKQYSGDLTQLLGMQEYFNEKVYILIPKNKRKANVREVSSINGIASNKTMVLSDCNYCSNVTAVIIRDSQAIPLIPLLSEHFSRAIYIDESENPEITYLIIRNEKPDIVLFERVERGMNSIFYQDPIVSSINIIDSIIVHQGIYQDKWTAKTASFEVNIRNATKLEIKAFLPEKVFKTAYDSKN